MTRRYFVSELPPAGAAVTLSTEESQHAIRVMRLQVGERVMLFDGRGTEAEAEVIELGRNRCELQVQASHLISREPPREVDLAIALPKPDRARELIERLTELGVKSVTPVIAQRTQRPPSSSLLRTRIRVEVRSVVVPIPQVGRFVSHRCRLGRRDRVAISARGIACPAYPFAACGSQGGCQVR